MKIDSENRPGLCIVNFYNAAFSTSVFKLLLILLLTIIHRYCMYGSRVHWADYLECLVNLSCDMER